MSDEGFHEIQLNGKQLVFLFMSATVVAVVIFLCGVMVGRGVRAPAATASAERGDAAISDPTVVVPSVATSSAPGTAPATSREKLTYPARLEVDDLPFENLKAAAPSPAPTTIAADAPEPPTELAEAPPVTTSASAPSAREEPSGNGFVVQVAAVRGRGEADVIARRLSGKGYPAFVTTAGPAANRVFRVRVGKYQDRRDAQSVATRLEREEQFKPWITR
jgi:cell division septation protein DedD